MNAPKTVKEFLSSLAPVSGIHYQIWGNDGMLAFSTGKAIPEELPVKEAGSFCSLILDQGIFQYRICDGNHFLCGVPLRDSRGVFGTLLAFGEKLTKNNLNGTGNDIEDYNAVQMERFLLDITKLVAKDLGVQEEINEIVQKLDESFEDLNLYPKISRQVKTFKFSDDMLKLLMEELLQNMRVDAAFALLSHKRKYRLELIKPGVSDKFPAQKNFFEKIINMIPPDEPSLNENYFIINDSRETPHFKNLIPVPYRFLAVRVQHQKMFYGWLGLICFNLKEIFRQGELKLLLTLAEQLAMVIANTELYKDLEQFVVNMVKSLVFAIEAKDRYTRGHSERVSTYAMLMGKQIGLSKKEYDDLKWASILHDIGKIGIPESVLNKQGVLTAAEYDIIKRHPEKGCKIIKPVEQLKDSLPSVMYHHEHYDGRGYPHGLKGDEIPVAARIIAIADTFDAINSSRAYRAAKSGEKALTAIDALAGSQLDPQFVELFKKVYKENLISEQEGELCQKYRNTSNPAKTAARTSVAEPS